MKALIATLRSPKYPLAVAAVILLGILLGSPPQPRTGMLDDSMPALGGPLDSTVQQGGVEAALAELRTRGVFSIPRISDSDTAQSEDGDGATGAPPAPEGLDRFTLVGIIRVGLSPEALMVDAAEQDRVFRALEGETLKDTQVQLARIGRTSVVLRLEDDQRQLALFPRPESELSDQ